MHKGALFLVSLLWGSSFVFTKRYFVVMDPVTFTAYNFLIAGAVFTFFVCWRGQKLTFRLKEGIILGIFLFFLETPQMIGLSETTAANTAFITALGILFIPFLEWWLYKHKITLLTYVAILVAFLGVYLLTGGVGNFNQGDLWIMLSALSCLFYMVFSNHFEQEKKSDMLILCTQQFLVTGALALITAFTLKIPLYLKTQGGSWLPLIVLALVFTLLPYLLIQWAERYANEVEITFYSILEPVVGGLAAWTIGQEIPTLAMWLGGGLIVGALIISESRKIVSATIPICFSK